MSPSLAHLCGPSGSADLVRFQYSFRQPTIHPVGPGAPATPRFDPLRPHHSIHRSLKIELTQFRGPQRSVIISFNKKFVWCVSRTSDSQNDFLILDDTPSENRDMEVVMSPQQLSSPQELDDITFVIDESLSRYERLLRRARVEDLSEVSGIGCLYQSGTDRFGRPVIVFVGKWFKFKEIDLDKALLYLIYLLDPLVKSDYVITYFHTNTSNANYPSFNWLKEVYNILPYKYKKNLKAFYIVHPTFWTKMMTWWFLTFMAPAIKQKVQSLPGVEYLYSVMHPSQLEIPAFITEHDMTINGLRYYNPNSPT